MSEQRRKLTFDDLDQVIEDAHKPLADGYVPTGKWILPNSRRPSTGVVCLRGQYQSNASQAYPILHVVTNEKRT